MKKMNESEWIEIGNQAKKTREELFKLMEMTSGKMPIVIVDQIIKSTKKLDEFRSLAEDRMLNQGDSEDLNIFYGKEKLPKKGGKK